jgi:hypothetical protein
MLFVFVYHASLFYFFHLVFIDCSYLKLVDVTSVIFFYSKSARLFLGDKYASSAFVDRSRDAILSVGTKPHSCVAEGVEHCMVSMDDGNALAFFNGIIRDCIPFLHSQLLKGKRVLVHCAMGISRSPLVILAFAVATRSLKCECPCDFARTVNSIISNHILRVRSAADLALTESKWEALIGWRISPTEGTCLLLFETLALAY